MITAICLCTLLSFMIGCDSVVINTNAGERKLVQTRGIRQMKISFELRTCGSVNLSIGNFHNAYLLKVNEREQTHGHVTRLLNRDKNGIYKEAMVVQQSRDLCFRPQWIQIDVKKSTFMIRDPCWSTSYVNWFSSKSHTFLTPLHIASQARAEWRFEQEPRCRRNTTEAIAAHSSDFFSLKRMHLKTYKKLTHSLGRMGFVIHKLRSLNITFSSCDTAIVQLAPSDLEILTNSYALHLNEFSPGLNRNVTVIRRCINKQCTPLQRIVPPPGVIRDSCKSKVTVFLSLRQFQIGVGFECKYSKGFEMRSSFQLNTIALRSIGEEYWTDWSVEPNVCQVRYPPFPTSTDHISNLESTDDHSATIAHDHNITEHHGNHSHINHIETSGKGETVRNMTFSTTSTEISGFNSTSATTNTERSTVSSLNRADDTSVKIVPENGCCHLHEAFSFTLLSWALFAPVFFK